MRKDYDKLKCPDCGFLKVLSTKAVKLRAKDIEAWDKKTCYSCKRAGPHKEAPSILNVGGVIFCQWNMEECKKQFSTKLGLLGHFVRKHYHECPRIPLHIEL